MNANVCIRIEPGKNSSLKSEVQNVVLDRYSYFAYKFLVISTSRPEHPVGFRPVSSVTLLPSLRLILKV